MKKTPPMTEKDVAKKLKTLKTTKQSVGRIAKELGNVRSPELRSAMLDFVLFDYSKWLGMSDRVFIFLSASPDNVKFIDVALIERLADVNKKVDWMARERILSFIRLAGDSINGVREGLPEECVDRIVAEFADTFGKYFISPTNAGTQVRGMLDQVLEFLDKTEKRDEYMRLVADAVLGAFEKYGWKNSEATVSSWTGVMWKNWKGADIKDLMGKLFSLLNIAGTSGGWERVTNLLAESENISLLYAGLSVRYWGFNEQQTTRIIRMALSLPEEKVKFYAEYLYPELYFKAFLAAPQLREECLERTIQYALSNNVIRGLGLLAALLISQHDEYSKHDLIWAYKTPNTKHPLGPGPEGEIADLERALQAMITVFQSTKNMTSSEWERNALSGGRQRGGGPSVTFFDFQVTPPGGLLEIARLFSKYIRCHSESAKKEEKRAREQGIDFQPGGFTPSLRCAYDSLERIFNVLVDSLDCLVLHPGVEYKDFPDNKQHPSLRGGARESTYVRDFFGNAAKFRAFTHVFLDDGITRAAAESLPPGYEDKPFFFTDEGAGRFYKQISAFADPNICGNAITEMANSIWRRQGQLASSGKNDPGESERLSQKIERTRRQAEGVIAVMVEKLKWDSSPSLDVGVELTAIKEFAPFFARELSKLDASCARETLSKILKGGGLGNSGAAQLLFSGELSGGGLEFLKEDNSKNLHNMITAILGAGGGDALPWWFSEEKFIRGCVEFTDRPRNFSIPDIVSRSAFLSIPVAFLKNNPANTWATELVAEFLSLCGRRVIQSARESAAENEGVRLYQYQSHLLAQQVQSLEELEALMGGRLAELERAEYPAKNKGDVKNEEPGFGGISF